MFLEIYLYGCLVSLLLELLEILRKHFNGEDFIVKNLVVTIVGVLFSWLGALLSSLAFLHNWYILKGENLVLLKGRKKG